MRPRLGKIGVGTATAITFLLLELALPASSDGAGSESINRRSFRCGTVDVTVSISTEASVRSPRFGRKLILVRLAGSNVEVAVESVRRKGSQVKIYKELIQDSDCIVTNGGFWGYDRSGAEMPLGLVVSSGKTLSPKMAWSSGGALCAGSGNLSFMKVRALEDVSQCYYALQSKPFLVEEGKVAVRGRTEDRFNRTAIGSDKSGGILVAGAFSPEGDAASLVEFASFIVHESSRTGDAALTVLSLDGGPGSQLLIPTLNLHFGDTSDNYVPSIVRFFQNPVEESHEQK